MDWLKQKANNNNYLLEYGNIYNKYYNPAVEYKMNNDIYIGTDIQQVDFSSMIESENNKNDQYVCTLGSFIQEDNYEKRSEIIDGSKILNETFCETIDRNKIVPDEYKEEYKMVIRIREDDDMINTVHIKEDPSNSYINTGVIEDDSNSIMDMQNSLNQFRMYQQQQLMYSPYSYNNYNYPQNNYYNQQNPNMINTAPSYGMGAVPVFNQNVTATSTFGEQPGYNANMNPFLNGNAIIENGEVHLNSCYDPEKIARRNAAVEARMRADGWSEKDIHPENSQYIEAPKVQMMPIRDTSPIQLAPFNPNQQIIPQQQPIIQNRIPVDPEVGIVIADGLSDGTIDGAFKNELKRINAGKSTFINSINKLYQAKNPVAQNRVITPMNLERLRFVAFRAAQTNEERMQVNQNFDRVFDYYTQIGRIEDESYNGLEMKPHQSGDNLFAKEIAPCIYAFADGSLYRDTEKGNIMKANGEIPPEYDYSLDFFNRVPNPNMPSTYPQQNVQQQIPNNIYTKQGPTYVAQQIIPQIDTNNMYHTPWEYHQMMETHMANYSIEHPDFDPYFYDESKGYTKHYNPAPFRDMDISGFDRLARKIISQNMQEEKRAKNDAIILSAYAPGIPFDSATMDPIAYSNTIQTLRKEQIDLNMMLSKAAHNYTNDKLDENREKELAEYYDPLKKMEDIKKAQTRTIYDHPKYEGLTPEEKSREEKKDNFYLRSMDIINAFNGSEEMQARKEADYQNMCKMIRTSHDTVLGINTEDRDSMSMKDFFNNAGRLYESIYREKERAQRRKDRINKRNVINCYFDKKTNTPIERNLTADLINHDETYALSYIKNNIKNTEVCYDCRGERDFKYENIDYNDNQNNAEDKLNMAIKNVLYSIYNNPNGINYESSDGITNVKFDTITGELNISAVKGGKFDKMANNTSQSSFEERMRMRKEKRKNE